MCEDLDAIKAELLAEASGSLSKKYRQMVYDYQRQLPGKNQSANKRRKLSKIPGFKEARAKFEKKPKAQQDRWMVKDALGYIKSEKRRPHYAKDLYRYNKAAFVKGLKEIKAIHSSTVTGKKKRDKIEKVMEKIRNFHVFRTGGLSVNEYVKAWDMAYVESIRGKKYNHQRFVQGTKKMLEGIKHFDQSFVTKMKSKYLKR